MRTPKKRHTVVATLALALSALPAVTALGPAHATTLECQSIPGPTPSAEIDTNNDGNAEVRVPSVRDISVCASGDVFADADVARLEPCGWTLTSCYRILIDAETSAGIGSTVQVCRSVDGVRSCSRVDQPEWHTGTPPMDTLCIGIDSSGGFPCGGGTALVAFE